MNNVEIKKYFGSHHIEEVESIISNTNILSENMKLKNPKITLILAIFLGIFGIDRLYQAGIKVWLCKLGMLMFSLGTWWLVDIGYAIPMTQETNYNKLVEAYSA